MARGTGRAATQSPSQVRQQVGPDAHRHREAWGAHGELGGRVQEWGGELPPGTPLGTHQSTDAL